MKKKSILLLACLFAAVFASQAADIYYYQSQFTAQVNSFKAGFKSEEDFERSVINLAKLQKGLESEARITKKEPLLSEIRAVFAFVGEISPEAKSYYLTLEQKQAAMELLDVQESEYDAKSFCLPIKEIKLWDSTYTCYMIDNPSDSMMINYRLEYSIRKTFSASSGFIDAGVSKSSSRAIYNAFGNVKAITFKQEKCERELQVAQYIQEKVEQPRVEKYPEPDYLSPAQKKALKQKEQERLKREKEKDKQAAVREKEKQKKEQLKEKAAAKKAADKEREEAKKAADKERQSKKK